MWGSGMIPRARLFDYYIVNLVGKFGIKTVYFLIFAWSELGQALLRNLWGSGDLEIWDARLFEYI